MEANSGSSITLGGASSDQPDLDQPRRPVRGRRDHYDHGRARHRRRRQRRRDRSGRDDQSRRRDDDRDDRRRKLWRLRVRRRRSHIDRPAQRLHDRRNRDRCLCLRRRLFDQSDARRDLNDGRECGRRAGRQRRVADAQQRDHYNVGIGRARSLFDRGELQVTATDVAVATSGGNFASAVYAQNGGSITLDGGSVETGSADVYAVVATPGGTLKLTGTSVTATGLGAGGIGLNGSTTSFTGSNLTIVTHGNYNSANEFGAAGITNQSYGDNTGGGSVQLTNSSITATGSQAIGAANQNAGTMSISGGSISTSGAQSSGVISLTAAKTTLTNVAISTGGVGALGVLSASGGQTTINGGTIQTIGSGALGLQASGTGSSITTALNDGVGLAITTSGADAHGAQADTGGTLTLVGGTVTTSGSGALGLYATGANSQITATICPSRLRAAISPTAFSPRTAERSR